jgi:formamidopyrimidine-DNA glycosylase
MPEGPEVRTIVRQMNKNILGKEVIELLFANDTENLLKNSTRNKLKKQLIGTHIKKVHRKGKYIDIEFSNELHLVLHLLITGRLSLLKSNKGGLPKYFRFGIKFEDDRILCLGDMRKWTKIEVLTKNERNAFKHFNDIGPDIYSKEFSIDRFLKILNSTQAIHSLLLDQKKMAGLGNIYANETLFTAKIHPKMKAKQIDKKRAGILFKEIKDIMDLALKEKGTTILPLLERNKAAVGWHTLDGKHGNFWKHVKIFQHETKPCPLCKTPIERVKIGGRSAFFCPTCQPEDNQIKLL